MCSNTASMPQKHPPAKTIVSSRGAAASARPALAVGSVALAGTSGVSLKTSAPPTSATATTLLRVKAEIIISLPHWSSFVTAVTLARFPARDQPRSAATDLQCGGAKVYLHNGGGALEPATLFVYSWAKDVAALLIEGTVCGFRAHRTRRGLTSLADEVVCRSSTGMSITIPCSSTRVRNSSYAPWRTFSSPVSTLVSPPS